MDLLSIIIIGIGLAMDCFAVSITKGICTKKHALKLTVRMAFLFGFFQAFMPLVGYMAGLRYAEHMKSFDHWIAFVLLTAIGGKMIIEDFKGHEPDCKKKKRKKNPLKWATLISLALATSIDALASGVIFIPFPGVIWQAVAIIGISSFLFTFAGMYIGMHFGKRFHVKVEAIGGLILIGMGTKILFEHLLN